MKYIHYSFYIIILLAFFLEIYFLYYLLWPFKFLEFSTPQSKILTPVVRRGDYVKWQADFTKYTNITAKVSRQLMNTYVYYYADETGSFPRGHQTAIVSVKIPDYISAGEYFIRNIYSYKINSLRTITYIQETEKFKVVE